MASQFIHILAFRFEMVNVPKLTNVTRLPFFKRRGDRSSEGLECNCRGDFGNSGTVRHFRNQFFLGHWLPPLVFGDLSMGGRIGYVSSEMLMGSTCVGLGGPCSLDWNAKIQNLFPQGVSVQAQ